MNPYPMLAVGLLMVFIEFYMPGGIMGTMGALLVVGSVVLYAIESQSPLATLLFAIAAAVLLGLLIKWTLWRIQKTKGQKTIYSDDAQEGFYASAYDTTAIGKIGVVSTDLRPGGHIRIEGKSHLAISQSGYINKGEEVIVTGGEGESLTVKRRTQKT